MGSKPQFSLSSTRTLIDWGWIYLKAKRIITIEEYDKYSTVHTIIINNARYINDFRDIIIGFISEFFNNNEVFLGFYRTDGVNLTSKQQMISKDKIEVFFRNHGNIKELNEYLTVAKVRMDSQTCNMLTLFFDYYLETILFNPKVDLNTFAGFHLNYQKHRFEDLILNHYTDMLFLYFDSGDFLVCFDSLVYDCERIKKSVMQTFKNVM